MKGYETAFDICEKVNKDLKVTEEQLLIYAGGWREDFFSIIIKDFQEYNDTVKYAIEKVKQLAEKTKQWDYIKDEYDESTKQVEIQYEHKK